MMKPSLEHELPTRRPVTWGHDRRMRERGRREEGRGERGRRDERRGGEGRHTLVGMLPRLMTVKLKSNVRCPASRAMSVLLWQNDRFASVRANRNPESTRKGCG